MSDLEGRRDRLERLWPSAGAWAGTLVMSGFCAVVALPFGPVPGVAAFAIAQLLMIALFVTASPTVGVRGEEFVAGRAHIPVRLLGDVTALDAEAMRRAAGPDLDARAHLCLRGWVRTGLRVDVADPQDPTPYWLVSARHAEAIGDAVRRLRRAG